MRDYSEDCMAPDKKMQKRKTEKENCKGIASATKNTLYNTKVVSQIF
jgi:hypothetical protein